MADEVPIYRSQVAAPNIGSLSIAPVRVPDLHSGEGLSQGIQEFGAALMKYAAFKKNADETVRTNTATTSFITGLDQAETEAAQSPNYETAPQDFHKKAEELSQKALADANLDPAERSALELRLRTLSIGAGGRVNAAALGKQVDVASAARGQQAIAMSRAAAAATSPVEVQAYKDQQLSTIDRNVRAGLLSADKGEAEKQAFLKSTDDQYIRQLIRTDPRRAQTELADVNRWKGFSGSEIETFRAAAETAVDKAQKDHLLGLAGGSKPEQASLAMNKALSRDHAARIFDNGIVQIEHGGRPLYLGGVGGGGKLRSAPAGTRPLAANDPRLAPVRYAGGIFMVDARYQKNFQGFISDYEAAGGVIGPNSGTLGARPNNASYHPIAAAIDINQTGRGVRSGGKTLPLDLEDKLAAKWGLRSGNHFRDNDNGHFDAGGSGGGDGGVTGGIDMSKAALEVSEAGAIGIGQIMPDTAREVAGKLNVLTAAGKPVSQMSNAEITDFLRQNPDLNRRLGLEYWNESLDAFDQNIALAAAGYNAGIGRAKEYQAAAFAKYGEDATPLEIAEVIGARGNKQTHDYVLKLFGAMNVPPTGPGVSPGARHETQTAVETAIGKQQAEADRTIKELASMDRALGGSDTLDQLKKGYAAWTPEFNAIVQHNIQAAAGGSTEAASFVQSVKTAQEAKPSIDAAWRLPPERLDDEIARLDARAAVGATHAEMVQLDAFKAVKSEIGANYKTDPVGLGDRAGMFVAQSLDPNAAPDDAGFLQSLAVRGRQATAAEQLYGTLAPFRPREVDALKQRFAEASAVERNALLGALASNLDPRVYNAAITQLGLDATTASAGRFAQTAPELTKKALVGAELLKTPGVENGAKALTDAAATKLGGDLYPPGSTALADVTRLATAVYAANSGLDATLFEKPNPELMATSLEEITGKITTIGGRQTAAPVGMSASQFEASLAGVTDETLLIAGGGYDGAGREIHADDIQDHAVLIQKAPRSDEYFVGVPTPSAPDGFRLYHTREAKPLVLNMRQIAAEQGRAAAAAARDAAGRATLRDITETGGLPGAGGGLMEMPAQTPPPAAAPAAPPAIASPEPPPAPPGPTVVGGQPLIGGVGGYSVPGLLK